MPRAGQLADSWVGCQVPASQNVRRLQSGTCEQSHHSPSLPRLTIRGASVGHLVRFQILSAGGSDGALGSTTVTIVPQASHRQTILSHGVLVACIATLQIGHGLGGSSSDVSVGMTNLQRREPRPECAAGRGAGVGLTPRCVRPAPPARTLKSRIQRELQVISSQLFGHGRLNQLYGRESQSLTAANRCGFFS